VKYIENYLYEVYILSFKIPLTQCLEFQNATRGYAIVSRFGYFAEEGLINPDLHRQVQACIPEKIINSQSLESCKTANSGILFRLSWWNLSSHTSLALIHAGCQAPQPIHL